MCHSLFKVTMLVQILITNFYSSVHCVKSVHIRRLSGLYSVQMRENTDQKNSEYGHFSHSEYDTGLMWVDIRKIFYNQMTTLHKTYENTGFY